MWIYLSLFHLWKSVCVLLMWTWGLLVSATLRLLSSVNLCVQLSDSYSSINVTSSMKSSQNTHEHRGVPSWVISQRPEHLSLLALLPPMSMLWTFGQMSQGCGLLESGIVCNPRCICSTSRHAWHKAVENKCLMSDWKAYIIYLFKKYSFVCLFKKCLFSAS